MPDDLLSMDDLEALRRDVEKATGTRIYFGSDDRLRLEKLPLDIPAVDHALAGGFGFDRVTLIIGEFSAGKTLLAMFAIRAAQRRDLSVAYVDGEKTWTPEWASQLGIDPSKVIVVRPRTGEDAFNAALALVRRRIGLLVIDSLASLRPRVETEGSESEVFNAVQVGAHARLINRGIQDLESENSGTCILAINQLRSGIGGYGNPETLPGGKGQGFYAWQIVRVRRARFIEDDGRRIGYVLRIRVEKSKQSEPFREAEVHYRFTGEIDEIVGLIETALETGAIRRDGVNYYIDDVDPETGEVRTHRFWGRPRLTEALKGSQELREAVSRAMQRAPDMTV